MQNFITNIDKEILYFIKTYIKNPLLDKIIPFISTLGNIGLIWIAISVILILSKKYKRAGILAIYSLLISAMIGELLLKNIIERTRPFTEISNIDLLIPPPTSYSFPSGHTASSFAAIGAYTKTIINKKVIIPLVLLACTMAFSRIYLMVHYPTDILGGIILGLLASKLAYKYFIVREKDENINI